MAVTDVPEAPGLMRISAAGSSRLCARQCRARGFTLLEILLVLLIMAIATAMVLPNAFSPPSARLAEEGRHLRQVLQLASEEAQLRGMPLRWTAFAQHYVFEVLDGEGKWRRLSDRVFVSHSLPDGVRIQHVRLQDGMSYPGLPPAGSPTQEDPPLGRVVLLPDGMLSMADVTLVSASGRLQLTLRPGPGGIRIAEDTQ